MQPPPLFGVVIAHRFTSDERMTTGRIIGVIIGFIGVTVMIGGAAFQSLGLDLLAPLAIVLATLSYALASVFGRRFRRYGVSPITTAAGQVTASAIILIPVVLIIDQPWMLPAPGIGTIGALLALGCKWWLGCSDVGGCAGMLGAWVAAGSPIWIQIRLEFRRYS